MSSRHSLVLAALTVLVPLVLGCASPEESSQAPEEGSPEEVPATSAETTPASQSASAPGDPCAALANEPVRYEAAGKPMAFTFEYPRGWEIDELFVDAASSVDVRHDLDGDGSPDFVLRFGHAPARPQENPQNLVDVWKRLPTMEEVTEVDVEGRTLYLAKSRIGDMIGYQALFPDPTSESRAYLVSGGVTRAPEGCEEEAVEAVERILTSMRPNPEMAPPEA